MHKCGCDVSLDRDYQVSSCPDTRTFWELARCNPVLRVSLVTATCSSRCCPHARAASCSWLANSALALPGYILFVMRYGCIRNSSEENASL